MRTAARSAVLLLAASQALAQPQSLHVEGLRKADGLSGVAITAVEADATGFAWFGSTAVVDRFDGVRVRPFRVGKSREDGYVYALEAAPDGALWAGGREGLWRRAADSLAFAPVRLESAGAADVRALLASGGALWAGTAGAGLFRVSAGGVRRFTAAGGHVASDSVRSVVSLPDGTLAVATSGGVTWLDPVSGRARHDRSTGGVVALAWSGGRLWAGLEAGSVVAVAPGRTSERVGSGLRISSMEPSAAHPGHVWVGNRNGGVRLLDARAGTLRRVGSVGGASEPFETVEVLALAERRGVLWVGTLEGVFRADVDRSLFRSYRTGPGETLARGGVMSAHVSPSAPGVVWVGGLGGLHRVDTGTGRTERWGDLPAPSFVTVSAIREGGGGAVWLGGLDMSLLRLTPATGALERVPLAPGLGGGVSVLAPSRHFPGRLWVGSTGGGLVRFDTRTRRAEAWYALREGAGAIPAREVWQVVEAGGALWVATDGEGLWRLDLAADRAERVAPRGCVIGDEVVSLAVGAGGGLWVGEADERLLRLDRQTGGCRAYTPEGGLPAEGVGAVFEDGRGYVWLGTSAGLFRLDPRDGVFTAFSEADGLATSTLYWSARDQGPDGTIAVGGPGGLTVFDPLDVAVDTRPAPLVLTGLRVDGEERPLVPGAPSGDVVLPHRQNDVAFEYAALDLRQPAKTRYRVRLRGASERWEPAGADVRYRALAPGRYTFEVRATNRDGYWGAPLAVPFQIRPPFWRTVPFWLAVVAALGAVGYAAHRYRVAQLLRVERTRRRIADDLHDGIGSKISSVALRLDMVGHRDGVPDATRTALATLSQTARSVVGDLRDTVWLVDAAFDDLAAIVSRMEQFAVDTLGGRGSVRGPASVPALRLPMEARRDLYLLFTEALHNAVRHSGAEHVAVRIEAEPHRVAFAVEDDGVGFDPGRVARGRGLETMRRRADALGGTLVWAPRAGGGTAVRFSADLG